MVKNPKKKKTERKRTSEETISIVADTIEAACSNFFLMIFPPDTISFRLKRNSLLLWGLVIARNVLEGDLTVGYEPKKEDKRAIEILEELGFPYFFISFETDKSRKRYYSSVTLDLESRAIVSTILDKIIDLECKKWWITTTTRSAPGVLTPGSEVLQ
jgi:hypothetical protein